MRLLLLSCFTKFWCFCCIFFHGHAGGLHAPIRCYKFCWFIWRIMCKSGFLVEIFWICFKRIQFFMCQFAKLFKQKFIALALQKMNEGETFLIDGYENFQEGQLRSRFARNLSRFINLLSLQCFVFLWTMIFTKSNRIKKRLIEGKFRKWTAWIFFQKRNVLCQNLNKMFIISYTFLFSNLGFPDNFSNTAENLDVKTLISTEIIESFWKKSKQFSFISGR